MSEKPESPIFVVETLPTGCFRVTVGGSSYTAALRDFFAGMTLMGLMANHDDEYEEDAVVEQSWEMADAMLSARGGSDE